ncbi:hypothetical protein CP532_2733 [Ophiocordyceps camponoti-leonardi (nom. inval.)]|nr:hypothetical protein CP532_2733 [Ophiocordyceps camponoti-leonardi (nom. inval.)]
MDDGIPYRAELALSFQALQQASQLSQEIIASDDQGVTEKTDLSPVTVADFAIQALLIATFKHAFPDDNFVGEESAASLRRNEVLLDRVWGLLQRLKPQQPCQLPATKQHMCDLIDDAGAASPRRGRTWVFDPIDGTKTYVRRELYAINIGLLVDGVQTVGAVGCPNLSINAKGPVRNADVASDGCIVYAVKGHGAYVRPLQDGPGSWRIPHLSRADDENIRFVTSFGLVDSGLDDVHETVAERLGASFPGCDLVPWVLRWAVLAMGFGNTTVWVYKRRDRFAKVWDHAGAMLLFEETGGKITDIYGNPMDLTVGRQLSKNFGFVAAPDMASTVITRQLEAVPLGRLQPQALSRGLELGTARTAAAISNAVRTILSCMLHSPSAQPSIKNPNGYEQVQLRELDDYGSPPLDPHKTTQLTPYTRYPTVSGDEWAFEIILSLASTGIFAGIVTIFFLIHDRPLYEWTLPVSPNSTISFLTTACSAALMHNVSSCIGQLKWLHFKQRPHQLYNLERFDEASRGPYGSMTFLMRVKWNLASIGALITICRLAFSPLAQEVIDLKPRDVSIGTEGLRQDPSMQSAILQGIYNISTPPTFSCGGACRWDRSYVSLGFKTTCQNVTEATLNTKICGRTTAADGNNFTSCNMTTPQGVHIPIRLQETDYLTTFRLNSSSPNYDDGTSSTERWAAVIRQFPTVLRFGVYRATSLNANSATDENVTDCSLMLTAYNYGGARSNGSEFRFDNVSEIDLPREGWQLRTDESAIRFRAEGLDLDIGLLEIITLQTYFKSSMISSEWVDGEGYHNINYGISAALMGDVDLRARFDNMAASMTAYLRSSSNQLLARGVRVESIVFVNIRWVWLIGPAMTQLATLLFTVCTVTRNRGSRNVPLWKSSALAVLSCVHDGESGSLRGGIRDIREIRKTAKESFVKLE